MRDRFSVAAYRVLEWFCPDGKKTFANVILKKIQNKGLLPYVRLGRMHAFSSRLALEQMTQRLSCCGERGTYYFEHLLLPHYNYVFDEQCGILPFGQWRGRTVYSNKPQEALAERRNLYRLHFGQAVCTAHEIFKLTDILDKKQKIADTVVLVHSDHGSRIAIENYQKIKPAGYTKSNYEQDWRGSFIAIRIPSMNGRIIDEPVRLDAFYKNLMENNFQKLDIEKLTRMSDSPY